MQPDNNAASAINKKSVRVRRWRKVLCIRLPFLILVLIYGTAPTIKDTAILRFIIKLTAPPVDNAANKMCIQFLSKTLGVPKSSMEILSGHRARKKHILVRLGRGGDFEKHAEELKQKIQSLN